MTNKPILKIRIVDFEKALAAQILEMDERFRKTNQEENKFISETAAFCVCSAYTPALYENDIYLYGSDSNYESHIQTNWFDSNKERDTYKAQLIEALKDWAKNWEGWKSDVSKMEMTVDGDVYTF